MIAHWDDGYGIGRAVSDAEHRMVIDLLNELEVAITVGAPTLEFISELPEREGFGDEVHGPQTQQVFNALAMAKARGHKYLHARINAYELF